jgi:rod shape-determining protein MreD
MMAYYRKKRDFNLYSRFIIYGVLAVVISFVQVLTFDFLAIENVTPDLLIILVVWIALYEGSIPALFSGFFIGIIFDIVSFDVIGTNALAKTVAAFIACAFYVREKENVNIGTFRFPLIVLSAAFVHNLIYYFFYIKASELNFWNFFITYGIAASFYTVIFSFFVMFFKLKKRY